MERRPFFSMLATILGVALGWLLMRPKQALASPETVDDVLTSRRHAFYTDPVVHKHVCTAATHIAARLCPENQSVRFHIVRLAVVDVLVLGNCFLQHSLRAPSGLIIYSPVNMELLYDRYTETTSYIWQSPWDNSRQSLRKVAHIRLDPYDALQRSKGWGLPDFQACTTEALLAAFDKHALRQMKSFLSAPLN